MDISQNTPTNTVDDKNITQEAYTPEGLPIIVETNFNSTVEKPVLNIEQEHPLENKVETKQEMVTPEKQEQITTISAVPPIPTHIVDKTTPTYPTHKMETNDIFSEKADEDERDFIENVRAAHDNN